MQRPDPEPRRTRRRHPPGPQIHAIRAAVLRQCDAPLAIEDLELEGPRDDEILVRLVASGICHTDIDLLDGWNQAEGAVVLGHEGAGVVEEVGARVQGVERGDRVVLSYQSCGSCAECLHGHPAGCERLMTLNFGFQRPDGSNGLWRSNVRGHFFGQSSFATHALASERNLVRVPADLPLELLAPLGCGLQTGAGTVLNTLAVPARASVAIFGSGAVGLAAVMAARIAGAAPIIAVDRVPKRLKLARELGATHAIDTRLEEVAARIAAITGGGVDFVLESTASPQLRRSGIAVLNPGGSLAEIATPGAAQSLPGGRRIVPVIQGDAVPQTFIPQLIELYRQGRFPFDRLIRYYDFAEINQAIADAQRGVTIKPVLRIR